MYTCQLFLKYRREIIFILGVLRFFKTMQSFLKIPAEVQSLPKKSEHVRSLSSTLADLRTHINASLLPVLLTSKIKDCEEGTDWYCHLFILHMVFVPYMSLS